MAGADLCPPGLEMVWVNRQGGGPLHHLDLVIGMGSATQELGVALGRPPLATRQEHTELWTELG